MRLFIFIAGWFLVGSEGHGYHKKDIRTQVKETYNSWNDADNSQNIMAMTSLCTEDCIFYPPGEPPVRGRQSLIHYYNALLKAGKWPQSKVLTFGRILEECGNIVVAEHTARMVLFDGRKYMGSGVWIFRMEDGVIKLRAVVWNSDAPIEPEKKQHVTPKPYMPYRRHYRYRHHYPNYRSYGTGARHVHY